MTKSKFVWLGSISILSALYFFSCEQEVSQNNFSTSFTTIDSAIIEKNETQEMVDILSQIVEDVDPQFNSYRNDSRVQLFKSLLEKANTSEKPSIWFQYCKELLRSGNVRECIREVENHFDKNKTLAQQMSKQNYVLFELLSIAYLRLGEQENCQLNHTEFSCVLPLQKPGIHTLPEGSTKAIEMYQSMYDRHPNEGYKWLINLGYMTLGKHPQEVPEKYLIKYPNWDLEQKKFPRFKEVSMNVNTAINGLSGGVCTEDFNNDGLMDLFVSDYGMEAQARLLINNGKGAFDDKTIEAGLEGIVGGLNCIHADYNNDGFTDIFVLRGAWWGQYGNHPNSLLKNNGDGTFTDVTKSAGVLKMKPTQTAAWADFNRDGFLDLFVGNESLKNAMNPCELYMNNGNGTFSEVASKVGADVNYFVKGVVWGDINNDNWPDLYLSILGGRNILLKNNQGVFQDISISAGVQEPMGSFPCWFWDVNNDGLEDLYVSGYSLEESHIMPKTFAVEMQGSKTNIAHSKLYINNGNETFTDATESYNLQKSSFAMGANFGDLDNDGNLDFYLGTGEPSFNSVTPNRMFRNVNGAKFEEVTSAGGFGHIQKGHGVAFVDLDNDGDQDVYAVMGGAYAADKFTNILFENPGFGNNWLIIELEGVTTNRSAIGTRIEIVLDNNKRIYRTVNTGGSFGSSSIQQEIGIGKATKINRLIITWQNGEVESFESVTINQKIAIKEGTNVIRKIPFSYIPFSESKGVHHHH